MTIKVVLEKKICLISLCHTQSLKSLVSKKLEKHCKTTLRTSLDSYRPFSNYTLADFKEMLHILKRKFRNTKGNVQGKRSQLESVIVSLDLQFVFKGAGCRKNVDNIELSLRNVFRLTRHLEDIGKPAAKYLQQLILLTEKDVDLVLQFDRSSKRQLFVSFELDNDLAEVCKLAASTANERVDIKNRYVPDIYAFKLSTKQYKGILSMDDFCSTEYRAIQDWKAQRSAATTISHDSPRGSSGYNNPGLALEMHCYLNEF
jgi:hypothetical protein